MHMRDQAEKLREMAQKTYESTHRAIIKKESTARVIAVTSGKGGVGKTNFTVNLALALSNYGKKVLIIDADLGLANIDIVLGSSAPYNISNLIENGLQITDIIVEGPNNIRFISGGSGIYNLANLSEQQLQYFIMQITLLDRWADVILIDTGAGINRNVLNFVMAADEVIIVTTPEPTSVTDAYAMMKVYAGHHGRAPLKLVVNRVADVDEGQTVVDKLIHVAFRFLGLPMTSLGFVYDDRNVSKAVKSQIPFLLSFPRSISSRCIEQIAHRLLYDKDISESTGIKGFLHRFLEIMK